MHHSLEFLIHLASVIDLKQDELDQTISPSRQAQLQDQLASLTARFQREYGRLVEDNETTPQAHLQAA